MNPQFSKQAGIALIVFTLLILFTMILHPAGGNVQHLLKIVPMLMITHAVAILSLPFAAIGFWGLTKRVGSQNFLAISAFALSSLALIAALLAASANGIVLPLFLRPYADASPEAIESIRPILAYNHSVNATFDYIYTAAFCLAILFWSVAILITKVLPRWLGILGVVVASYGWIVLFAGISPASLYGFHLFVAGLICWTIVVGMALIRTNQG